MNLPQFKTSLPRPIPVNQDLPWTIETHGLVAVYEFVMPDTSHRTVGVYFSSSLRRNRKYLWVYYVRFSAQWHRLPIIADLQFGRLTPAPTSSAKPLRNRLTSRLWAASLMDLRWRGEPPPRKRDDAATMQAQVTWIVQAHYEEQVLKQVRNALTAEE